MWVTNKKLDLSTHVGHEALSANSIVPLSLLCFWDCLFFFLRRDLDVISGGLNETVEKQQNNV